MRISSMVSETVVTGYRFFLFKQRTAYGVRISDWSSDVCSSDLQGRELLGPRDVLVIDEAGMIGTRQMERVLSAAERAGAKVVLVGDAEQLQAIEAGAAFRSLAERHGAAEISEVRRQHEDWQKGATRALATGRTGEAIQIG